MEKYYSILERNAFSLGCFGFVNSSCVRPVDLHRQIDIVYEEDDIVTRTLIDFINSDYQESYEIIPVTTMKLTPKTESLFKISDEYPERFFQWSDKFIDIISNFES